VAHSVLLGFAPDSEVATTTQESKECHYSAPTAADDDLLVAGLREGRESAYEALIERFQSPVYNLICRLLDDTSEASDVVQEVFLKVFRNVNSFRNESSLKTWVYRIAVNEAHNQRRWFTRHRRKEVGLEDDEGGWSFEDYASDSGRSPLDLALDHEMRLLIDEALEEVNPIYRTAVILRDIEDLNYEEIAAVLQISLGTVKSRILRGREALRKRLVSRMEPTLQLSPQPAD
jgi:RNA polymerase sigma-70 factor, ECF subfamily